MYKLLVFIIRAIIYYILVFELIFKIYVDAVIWSMISARLTNIIPMGRFQNAALYRLIVTFYSS